jgi:hypothetical protein
MEARMSTLRYKGKTYRIVPEIVDEGCDGCAFVNIDVCPHNDFDIEYSCWDDAECRGSSTILIPNTDKALATWVAWRMNGCTEDDDAYQD